MRIVNKDWLESKVEEINKWLEDNPTHQDRRIKEQNKTFYIDKLRELDETNENFIELWSK